jgi:hypothetical protein
MNTAPMTWQAFKQMLTNNPDLHLQFQYADNQWVNAAYHITEIKQTLITSVDCGGVMNAWTEIIVQLYEPQNQQQLRAMQANKALKIIDVVEKALSLNPNGIVKIEFGNARFDTRQLLPNGITTDGENLVVDLHPDTVQCKAIDRGGNCGEPAQKAKVELKNLAVAESCCTPGGGCC